MKYTLTFTKNKDKIVRLKAKKNGYPYSCGGIEWTENTTHDCDDLTPFYGDPNQAKRLGLDGHCIAEVDSRIIVTVNKTEKESNGEPPKSKN